MGVKLGRRAVIDGGGYIYGGKLAVGMNSFVNRNCYFDLTAHVSIGANVEIGHGVTFVTAVHELGTRDRRAGRVSGKPIRIGDGAWIGANATLLPGVTIGGGSVVAAGAVVNGDVPADVVVGGVPARKLRDLRTDPPTS